MELEAMVERLERQAASRALDEAESDSSEDGDMRPADHATTQRQVRATGAQQRKMEAQRHSTACGVNRSKLRCRLRQGGDGGQLTTAHQSLMKMT